MNLGIGGDKTPNLLWRLDHGGVECLAPRLVLVLIGQNNIFSTVETGVAAAAQGFQRSGANLCEKVPAAHVIAVKIFPAHAPGHAFYEDIRKTNAALDALLLERDAHVRELDLTADFLAVDGTM